MAWWDNLSPGNPHNPNGEEYWASATPKELERLKQKSDAWEQEREQIVAHLPTLKEIQDELAATRRRSAIGNLSPHALTPLATPKLDVRPPSRVREALKTGTDPLGSHLPSLYPNATKKPASSSRQIGNTLPGLQPPPVVQRSAQDQYDQAANIPHRTLGNLRRQPPRIIFPEDEG
ncbi:MAG: hypothetical protein LBK92_02760 [Endomicrobium sp.]|jgi:hypothetical protein|nr:hypothetical protein [Endomicrobium sp.]